MPLSQWSARVFLIYFFSHITAAHRYSIFAQSTTYSYHQNKIVLISYFHFLVLFNFPFIHSIISIIWQRTVKNRFGAHPKWPNPKQNMLQRELAFKCKGSVSEEEECNIRERMHLRTQAECGKPFSQAEQVLLSDKSRICKEVALSLWWLSFQWPCLMRLQLAQNSSHHWNTVWMLIDLHPPRLNGLSLPTPTFPQRCSAATNWKEKQKQTSLLRIMSKKAYIICMNHIGFNLMLWCI